MKIFDLLYVQSTGQLFEMKDVMNVELLTVGYSGRGRWTNEPRSHALVGSGPIPRGKWKVLAARDLPRLGPVCIPLVPASYLTDTFGRSGFYFHGDNSRADRSASSGCIIVGRSIRDAISLVADRSLFVIE